MVEAKHDTIFALSSGAGPAGVAVIRISGPEAEEIETLLKVALPAPRTAAVRTLYDELTDERLDAALMLYFPAPASFTGENIVEIQCHGGRATVDAILSALARLEGFRPAEAGEFTRRAVENGTLDLLQAEALGDLINAETEAQRRQALRQHEGALGAIYEDWRGRIIKAAAWIEASIDFPDEEIPEGATEASRGELAAIRAKIAAHLADGRRGEILREGLHVAVIGAPNAGKSSLVNALAQRDVAIVTDIPGTTRDVIEVRLDLHGYPVILSDTAGLREASDAVEAEGVRRAKARAESADVRLLILDGASHESYAAPDAEIIVRSKADLVAVREEGDWISVKTGEGIQDLIERIAELARMRLGGESPSLTRARHRVAFEEAVAALDAALALVPPEPELVAEHVRRAVHALGRITGRVDLDELLDVVFRDFCIGK
jgi:tRNA modification GTPase